MCIILSFEMHIVFLSPHPYPYVKMERENGHFINNAGLGLQVGGDNLQLHFGIKYIVEMHSVFPFQIHIVFPYHHPYPTYK